MGEQGYYRTPTIHADTVVFASEGDLWSVPATGGQATRLTANPGQASWPALSADGRLLAYTGRDEGQTEVYVMPAGGGEARRLTFLGGDLRVAGWHPDGRVVFATNARRPFARDYDLMAVAPSGGEPRALPCGPSVSVSYGPTGGWVLGRYTTDIARWKRYRGGLTGELWIDRDGVGTWSRLIDLAGNVAMPVWVGERVYFVSDHEGIGNVYSCAVDGTDLRRHTHHGDYYARHPASDGKRLVYHAGADLYLLDPSTDETRRIDIDYRSPRAQRKRRFVDAGRHMQSYALHPKGHSVVVTSRGRPFTMAHWEEAVSQHGVADGVRYRLAAYLADGERLVAVSDAGGEEALEVLAVDASRPAERLGDLDVGSPDGLYPAPVNDLVAVTNQRNELVLVDVGRATATVVDRSAYGRIQGASWSPDGRWLAYSISPTRQTSVIRLCDASTGETHEASRAVLHDVRPSFDPEGKYLYFISYRTFKPVYDDLHFDLGFPRGAKPCLITLQADAPSPFAATPRAPGEPLGGEEPEPPSATDPDDEPVGGDVDRPAATVTDAPAADEGAAPGQTEESPRDAGEADKQPKPVRVDLEGIADRILAFPVAEGRYDAIYGAKGKALFTVHPVATPDAAPFGDHDPPGSTLEAFAFEDSKRTTVARDVHDFTVTADGKALLYRSGRRLRALKAGEKAPDGDKPGRATGWLDLGRIKVSVDPPLEWRQMYHEAWRLQRDHFWTEDMSGVDWQVVSDRYAPLLDRIGSRSELSDLLWEMQGELGTSHAYEIGGDYPAEPAYGQGFLGADLRADGETGEFLVERLYAGDRWTKDAGSPLARVGAGVRAGDVLLAVNGRRVGDGVSPAELLVNQAGQEVRLALRRDRAGDEGGPLHFSISVPTLRDERPARYREWVEANRARVHDATGGRVGYVHIPDMGPAGYAEFHRGFLVEVDRDALVVDVRYNGGGHVSQLILEKLARKRLGYDAQRWGDPVPYPFESVFGPIVAIANEFAGSDGDIFTHAFKMMGLGPIVGTRTWGGVIGISGRQSLVDGGITTQPEFSFWFSDIHWGLENYGTEPDIEVSIRPDEHAAGIDTQLDRAIDEVLRLLAAYPAGPPPLGDRPRLDLPRLPGT
jgi:tricorn protease